jgi:hypothetical protein
MALRRRSGMRTLKGSVLRHANDGRWEDGHTLDMSLEGSMGVVGA